jgi:hypothetical protein
VSADSLATFAAAGLALYVGHHVGDYWIQTDHQARHKGDAGADGALQCLLHVLSYLATQAALLAAVAVVTGWAADTAGVVLALGVSGVTHYLADRREHGIMLRLARLLPGKRDFLKLGVPRNGRMVTTHDFAGQAHTELVDNPSLGTGAWALDQGWHIFWGVFVPALVLAGMS